MTKVSKIITAERLNQIGYLAQLGFNIDYMATLPDLEDFTQEKTIQPIFDGFKRLNEKTIKKCRCIYFTAKFMLLLPSNLRSSPILKM